MEAKWYVINVRSGFEKKAVASIKENAEKKIVHELFEEFIIPSENILQLRRGRNVNVEKKLLPGYVLVKVDMNDLAWNIIKNSQHVGKLLGSDNKPLPISEEEINRVYKLVEDGRVVRELVGNYEIGENVKIIDGSFITFTGKVEKVNAQRKRMKVAVNILSREMSVELDFGQVEKIN